MLRTTDSTREFIGVYTCSAVSAGWMRRNVCISIAWLRTSTGSSTPPGSFTGQKIMGWLYHLADVPFPPLSTSTSPLCAYMCMYLYRVILREKTCRKYETKYVNSTFRFRENRTYKFVKYTWTWLTPLTRHDRIIDKRLFYM